LARENIQAKEIALVEWTEVPLSSIAWLADL
jgi:hypothetical protein